MAQRFVPDDPRMRDQLQQRGTTAELREQPHRRMPRRHYDVIDLVVLLAEERSRPLTSPLTAPKPARPYQTLPHVTISDVTGLIELVQAKGGRADLHQLGRDLKMEADELFSYVEERGIFRLEAPETQEEA